jgi:hypothetical protein
MDFAYCTNISAPLQHPVALRTSGFALCFCVICVQSPLLFIRRFLFIDTKYFRLTGHLHEYRLLWLKNLLLTVLVFCLQWAADSSVTKVYTPEEMQFS